MTAGCLSCYAINSVFSPRVAVRQLMAEANVPGVLLRLALVSSCASAAILAYALTHVPDDHFLSGQSPSGVVFEALISAALALVVVRSSIFVWKHVLRDASPKHGALAAAGLTLMLAVVVSSVQEVAFAFSHVLPSWAQYLLFAACLLTGIGLLRLYDVRIFQIEMQPAAVWNLSVFLTLVMVIPFVMVAAHRLFAADNVGISGWVSWFLT